MKKKFNFKWALLSFAEVCFLVGITIVAVVPFSCKVSTQGVQLLEGDYVAPKLETYLVLDSKTIELVFTEQVKVTGTVVSPFVEGESDSDEHSTTEDLSPALSLAAGENGAISSEVVYDENDLNVVRVLLGQDADVGKKYELYGVVEDLHGNSLTFSVPFTGYNSRIPKLIMTEIQTDMVSKNSTEKKDGTRRAEFVEFLALSDGNLAGLEICSGTYGEEKKFVFPAVEVKRGEIFLVHMRNTGTGCVSEEGEDLSLAQGSYTSESIRDLWAENESKCFGSKTDIIIVRNSLTDTIVDAVMFRESSVTDWSGLKIDFSEEVAASALYEGSAVDYATIADEKTAALTLTRADSLTIYEKVLSGSEDISLSVYNADTWLANSKSSAGLIQ
ncbi:MAG: hypothetical protein K5829_15290 [Treponema sp.]|nr:hypothetical protein [Treponema sp.]